MPKEENRKGGKVTAHARESSTGHSDRTKTKSIKII